MADLREREQLHIVPDLADILERDGEQGVVVEAPDDADGNADFGDVIDPVGVVASSPGAGTTIRLARYQLSIAVSAPGWPQSSI